MGALPFEAMLLSTCCSREFVNNIDGQRGLAQRNYGGIQMVEGQDGVLELFIAPQPLAKSIAQP
jgi:hypothetical protein